MHEWLSFRLVASNHVYKAHVYKRINERLNLSLSCSCCWFFFSSRHCSFYSPKLSIIYSYAVDVKKCWSLATMHTCAHNITTSYLSLSRALWMSVCINKFVCLLRVTWDKAEKKKESSDVNKEQHRIWSLLIYKIATDRWPENPKEIIQRKTRPNGKETQIKTPKMKITLNMVTWVYCIRRHSVSLITLRTRNVIHENEWAGVHVCMYACMFASLFVIIIGRCLVFSSDLRSAVIAHIN